MDRPDLDVYMMGLAMMASTRATCSRRAVGAILTNARNHVIASGYNGVPRSLPHCSAQMCPGMLAASGKDLDGCMAIHAEQNALLQCHDTDTIRTCYVTSRPCLTCTKLLLNTTCQHIVYLYPYPHEIAKTLWANAGRTENMLDSSKVKELQLLFQLMSGRSESALT